MFAIFFHYQENQPLTRHTATCFLEMMIHHCIFDICNMAVATTTAHPSEVPEYITGSCCTICSFMCSALLNNGCRFPPCSSSYYIVYSAIYIHRCSYLINGFVMNTYISLGHTTRFWNNLHQVGSCWKDGSDKQLNSLLKYENQRSLCFLVEI